MSSLRVPTPLRLAMLALFAAALITGCTSSSSGILPANLSTVTMSAMTPATVSLQAGQQQQFTVSVSGASDTAIEWNIVDASGNSHFSGDTAVGTISAGGLYTAPSTSSTLNLTLYAGAAADSSISRSATIKITPLPPPVAVSISPINAVAETCPATPCTAASMIDFSAQVSNAANTSVTWEVNHVPGGNSTAGTISASGVYTAPAALPNPAMVTVTAVSNADNTKSASAIVSLSAPGTIAVSLNQATVNLMAGQTFNFSSTVVGTPDAAVTWSVSCASGSCGTCASGTCGTITLTGTSTATYNAPASVSSTIVVNVTATSVVDTTKSATASVTVTSPVQPTLSITFSTTPVMPQGTLTITAQVNNLPSGSTPPTVTWNPTADTFCITSDEGDNDFCGDSDGDPSPELDGPGTLTPTGAQQATYTAPAVIFAGPNSKFLAIASCPQATQSQPYVHISATVTVNSTNLNADACIEVVPNTVF